MNVNVIYRYLSQPPKRQNRLGSNFLFLRRQRSHIQWKEVCRRKIQQPSKIINIISYAMYIYIYKLIASLKKVYIEYTKLLY